MKGLNLRVVLCFVPLVITACSTYYHPTNLTRLPPPEYASSHMGSYESRLPSHISSAEKTVLVNPRVHAWGAYQDGSLVRAGLATAGSSWCSDIHRACRTHIGTYHIYSLGSPSCKSHIFPVPRGGAPMPYCMYFSGGQALHGSPAGEVVEGNISHGCVRMEVSDAEWLRYNFANIGTRVVVEPY